MQLIVNIIVLSSIYALIACGYVLIYRVSRVLNLAHGELMMIGAYMLVSTASLFNGDPLIGAGRWPWCLSLTSASLVYVLLMRKMTGEMVLAAILTTIAIGILLRGLIVLIWSAQQQYPAAGARLDQPVDRAIGGRAHFGVRRADGDHDRRVYGGLFAFLRFGRWGVRMRAAGQNPLLAAQRGINLHGNLCAGLGAFDPHRLARRHADRARFRPRPAPWR